MNEKILKFHSDTPGPPYTMYQPMQKKKMIRKFPRIWAGRGIQQIHGESPM